MTNELNIIKMECVPLDTNVYFTDDGTIFYKKFTAPERLYVRSYGKEIDAKLPCSIHSIDTFGNAIYFSSKEKAYKAAFAANTITVANLRDKIEGETFVYWGLCTLLKNGELFVYRLADNPNNDDIRIYNASQNRNGLEMKGIHRETVFYTYKGSSPRPGVHRLGANQIALMMKYADSCVPYFNESSSLIFIARNDSDILVLDTKTMKFLPSLNLEAFGGSAWKIWKIAFACGREITAFAKMADKYYLVTALLPNEYVRSADPVLISNTPIDKEHIEDEMEGIHLGNVVDQCCCSICNENYDSEKIIPRFLDCGHTFCELCLDKICITKKFIAIKCPNCSHITYKPYGKNLPKNYDMISMAEQLLKSRLDPTVKCKSCGTKRPSSTVRMCIKEDCEMFNQLLCLACALDGGHGGHVVKYDVKMEKIRKELREEVTKLCTAVDEKKNKVVDLTEQVVAMAETLKMNLNNANIPSEVIGQLETLTSEQDATEYREIVNDLAKTLVDKFDTVSEALNSVLASGNEFNCSE